MLPCLVGQFCLPLVVSHFWLGCLFFSFYGTVAPCLSPWPLAHEGCQAGLWNLLIFSFKKSILPFWRTSTEEVLMGLRVKFVALMFLCVLVYSFGQDQAWPKRYDQNSHGAWSPASEKSSVFRWSRKITWAIFNWVVEHEKLYKSI